MSREEISHGMQWCVSVWVMKFSQTIGAGFDADEVMPRRVPVRFSWRPYGDSWKGGMLRGVSVGVQAWGYGSGDLCVLSFESRKAIYVLLCATGKAVPSGSVPSALL